MNSTSFKYSINKERLMHRLLELGQIGKQPSGGITRLALSQEDEQALVLVAEYMREAGLSVRTDAAGNLIGRKEGRRTNAPIVLTGSHIDTVIEGGMFDGCLGVIGGIEALHSMNEQGIVTEHPIEVNVYRDEEGVRFGGMGLSGARGMTGKIEPERLLYTDKEGISIAEAMTAVGLNPDRIQEAALSKESVKAHVELHIEQGKVLEDQGVPVGIVTGICSASRSSVTIVGEAGHAGTTPMNLRRDPLAGAADIIKVLEAEAIKSGTAVGTVGQFQIYPGAVNVIPGKVEFSVDIRDMNPEVLDQVVETVIEQSKQICQERMLDLDFRVHGKGTAKRCSQVIQEVIGNAIRSIGIRTYSLPSGAGHDSGVFAGFCPMGMIFVRSHKGISHNPEERSSEEDCASGVEVLYRTLLELAERVPAATPSSTI